jgi:glycosyltransferase involved in cell wall biosynthesis
MRLNVIAPINQTGYGVVGTNVVAALARLGHEPALWPIGGVEVSAALRPPIDTALARALDGVLAPSRWAAGVLAAHGIPAQRVRVTPFGVDPAVFGPDAEAGRPREGPTVFLNVGKWEVRKGHDVLAGAFNAAFGPHDVRLVMHRP